MRRPVSNIQLNRLIDSFTDSQKLRNQLSDRLINGRTYIDIGLRMDGDKKIRNDMIQFNENLERFYRFCEKKGEFDNV